MSKLAALAAKRRQKENANSAPPEKATESEPKDEYAASLSKLSLGDPSRRRNIKDKDEDTVMAENSTAPDKDGNEEAIESDFAKNLEDEPIVERIRPSAFANTFLNTTSMATPGTSIDPALLKNNSPSFDFKDPSPDDIIFKAQTGRTR